MQTYETQGRTQFTQMQVSHCATLPW